MMQRLGRVNVLFVGQRDRSLDSFGYVHVMSPIHKLPYKAISAGVMARMLVQRLGGIEEGIKFNHFFVSLLSLVREQLPKELYDVCGKQLEHPRFKEFWITKWGLLNKKSETIWKSFIRKDGRGKDAPLMWKKLVELTSTEETISFLKEASIQLKNRQAYILNVIILWTEVFNVINRFITASNCARRAITLLIKFAFRKLPFRNQDLGSASWTYCLDGFESKFGFLYLFSLSTKWMKHHSACLFSIATGQEQPEPLWGENPGHFLSGIGYHFTRLVSFSGLHSYSFLMLKKGMPAVTEYELFSATEDLFEVLGTERRPRGVQEDICPDIVTERNFAMFTFEERLSWVIKQVKRTTIELFSNSKLGSIEVPIPSKSSHFQSTRSDVGALGYIVRNKLRQHLRPEDRVRLEAKLHINPLPSNGDKEIIETKGGAEHDALPSQPTTLSEGKELYMMLNSLNAYKTLISPDPSQDECICRSMQGPNRDTELIRDTFLNALRSNVKGREGNYVLPIALAEPLKTRMITRGPAERYWALKGVQKVTWEVLKDHPTFRAVGRPLTTEDIQMLHTTGPINGPLGEAEVYRSGDYSRATDYLHPDLSNTVVNQLCDIWCVDDDFRCLYLDSLTNSLIVKGTRDVRDWESATEYEKYLSDRYDTSVGRRVGTMFFGRRQKWGQLMGSVTSFPILCIINAALNRAYLELRYGLPDGTLRLIDCPMLINGDDVLLRDIASADGLWDKVVSTGGLEPSIGKNYTTKKFAIINSTLYTPHHTLNGIVFYESPYLNLSLLTLNLEDKREFRDFTASGVSLDPQLGDIGQVSKKLVSGFDDDDKAWLMSQFVIQPGVKKILRSVPEGVSYYASKAVGGIGLACHGLSQPLNKKQLGYYTRVAATRDELAPLWPNITDSRAGETMYQHVSPTSSVDFYSLDGESSRIPNSCYYPILVQGSLMGEWDSWFGIGGMFGPTNPKARTVFRPKIIDEYFRAHRHPWRWSEIANFPWKRIQVAAYDSGPIAYIDYGCQREYQGISDSRFLGHLLAPSAADGSLPADARLERGEYSRSDHDIVLDDV